MPRLGLGVWRRRWLRSNQFSKMGFEAGYRLIDTAAVYKMKQGWAKAFVNRVFPRRNFRDDEIME